MFHRLRLLIAAIVLCVVSSPAKGDDLSDSTRAAALTFENLRKEIEGEVLQSAQLIRALGEYRVDLVVFMRAYAGAVNDCERGEEPRATDEALVRLARSWGVLQKEVQFPHHLSLFNRHSRATGWFHSAHAEALAECMFPPPPPVEPPGFPEPTWIGSPEGFTRLADGVFFPAPKLLSPMLSSWLGANSWSSATKNREPISGKVPGDVLYLASGTYENFRWTLTYDVNMDVVRANPTRVVDANTARTFTYLNDDGTLRYGLNDRDSLKTKGAWAEDGWFTWGYDPQTWIIGEAPGLDGTPTTIVAGARTYMEYVGAASLANIEFRGPTGKSGSEGILQVENPKIELNGKSVAYAHNWPENPEAKYGEWQGFRDIEFFNIHVNGEWDFLTMTGEQSKWGSLWYRLGRSARGDDVPGFAWRGGKIHGIFTEHCQYHHNVIATSPDAWALLYEDVHFGPCKRTAIQVVARTSEGPDGRGRIVIRNCTIKDTCLEDAGGGSALTFAGNHVGDVFIENVDCWLGDPTEIHPDYHGNITGGFVSHAGELSGGRPTRAITIEGSTFRVGPLTGKGSARRPNLQVGDVGTFSLLSTTVIQAADAREAIAFEDGTLGRVILDAACDVRGDIRWGDQVWRDVDEDGDGWDDGTAWPVFLAEIESLPKVEVIRSGE